MSIDSRGTVSAGTSCSRHDDYRMLHSVIRNGLEIESDSVTIALEYHYDDNTSSHSFYMSTFLAPYLPSMGDSCYLSHESNQIASNSAKTQTDSNSPWNDFDLNVNVPWTEETYNYYVEV